MSTTTLKAATKQEGVASSPTSGRNALPTPSFFPSYALDQAFCGIGAGVVSTLCMQPLDLLKVRLQVSTTASTSIWRALREIGQAEGIRGLYRGLTPNLVGNASSWGLYFLWYTLIKARKEGNSPTTGKLSPGQHLLASAESGVITAVMTNPLWVVKTRMFTTPATSPGGYKGVVDGLVTLTRKEGVRGLSKGMLLSLIGVSNGALQFMAYEELKSWRIGVRGSSELSNVEYVLMSGSAKLFAIGITYPYQVVRSRIQYQPSSTQPYTSIPNVISRTLKAEGFTGFYKGLGTNAVRILPGTCVTFVVYEQLSRALKKRAT